MGELFSLLTFEHIQEVVHLSAGGHSMRTDIFEIKLPVEKFFNQECLSDTPPAVDYDQLRSVRVQASFQFRVFFVAANKFIHTFMFWCKITHLELPKQILEPLIWYYLWNITL